MSQDYISIVKKTWEELTPKGMDVSIAFYDKLFTNHPELKKLFSTKIERQAEKLLFTLSYVVVNLERLSEIKPAVAELGKLHKNAYFVEPEDYPKVKEALLHSISSNLKHIWNDDMQEAWTWAFDTLAEIMIAATN